MNVKRFFSTNQNRTLTSAKHLSYTEDASNANERWCIIVLQNRFAELLAAHERKTKRKWTYEDITAVTGIASSTLSAYAQNKIRRFDATTIERLIKFLDVDVTDFFVVVPGDGEEESPEVMAAALTV